MKHRNDVCCKDCGFSVWDPDRRGLFLACGLGNVDSRTIAVRTARKFLVIDCDGSKEVQRHGSAGWTVFDIALEKHKGQSTIDAPAPVKTIGGAIVDNKIKTKKEQRTLDLFGEGVHG